MENIQNEKKDISHVNTKEFQNINDNTEINKVLTKEIIVNNNELRLFLLI